ncbi:MAG: hypothetical protein C4324_09375 [Blastocatellia bacterium]
MNREFDKQIDAILRDLGQSGIDERQPLDGMHPEPDEFAAFSAAKMSKAAREAFILHLSDCSRCRKILAGQTLAVLENENELSPAAPSRSNGSLRRWMQIIPRPALALTAILLIFAGLFAVAILRNSEKTEVSSLKEFPEPASGLLTSEPVSSSPEESNTTATRSNTGLKQEAANSTRGVPLGQPKDITKAAAEKTEAAANSAPPQTPMLRSGAPSDSAARQSAEQVVRAESATRAAPAPPPDSRPKEDLAGQVSNSEQTADAALLKSAISKNKSRADKQVVENPRASNAAGSVNRFGGKIFELKKGIWTDSDYRTGEVLTLIKRESAGFRQLDLQLRATVEAIGTPIIVKWKDKAFRID